MYEYRSEKISQSITRITDASETSMFLVEGTDKAVLIDTGTGVKGLDDYIRKLTKLPLTVILTHGHLDHAGGSVLFSEVYVHPKDSRIIADGSKEERAAYTAHMLSFAADREKTENAPEAHITPEEVMPHMLETADREKKYLPLKDGMIFDLGGISIEIIEVPGHTEGSCCMLFREERAILFGDACNPNTLVNFEHSTAVSTYKKSLLRLKTFSDRYDTVYLSHGGPEVNPVVLDENIELCDEILAGTDDHVAEIGMDGLPCYRAKKMEGWFRLDGGTGNIVYSDRTRC